MTKLERAFADKAVALELYFDKWITGPELIDHLDRAYVQIEELQITLRMRDSELSHIKNRIRCLMALKAKADVLLSCSLNYLPTELKESIDKYLDEAAKELDGE